MNNQEHCFRINLCLKDGLDSMIFWWNNIPSYIGNFNTYRQQCILNYITIGTDGFSCSPSSTKFCVVFLCFIPLHASNVKYNFIHSIYLHIECTCSFWLFIFVVCFSVKSIYSYEYTNVANPSHRFEIVYLSLTFA